MFTPCAREPHPHADILSPDTVLLRKSGPRLRSDPAISSSSDPEHIPLELLLEGHQSSQTTSHQSDRILWKQGSLSPRPIIKDAPQHQARQPAEADSPKLSLPSLPSTVLIPSAERRLSQANPNTTPTHSARQDPKDDRRIVNTSGPNPLWRKL